MGDAFLDRWSIVHAAWGIIIGSTKLLTPSQWLIIHTIYELWENSESGSVVKILLKHEKDTWRNVTGDTLSAMAGYGIGMEVR